MAKVPIKDWPLYVARLGERAHRAAERGILAGAQRCVQVVQRSVETAPPASPSGHDGAINTGDYRRRWRVAAIAKGARLYNEHPAAAVIEKGRRAGARVPRLVDIERWARRRLGLSPAEARAARFPIARAISRRGLRARNVMGRVLDEMTAIVAREAGRELAAEWRR